MPLALQPEDCIVGDANPHLINFWRWVQQDGIRTLPFENSELAYQANRDCFNQHKSDAIDAQLFYYLNRTGINGLCRFSKQGKFNVPYGYRKSITYRADFSLLRQAIAQWQFRALDFRDFLSLHYNPTEDFLYLDPPYDTTFSQYSGKTFTQGDRQDLANLTTLATAPVVVHDLLTPNTIQLYRDAGFFISRVPRNYQVAPDPQHRSCVWEIFGTKNLPQPTYHLCFASDFNCVPLHLEFNPTRKQDAMRLARVHSNKLGQAIALYDAHWRKIYVADSDSYVQPAFDWGQPAPATELHITQTR